MLLLNQLEHKQGLQGLEDSSTPQNQPHTNHIQYASGHNLANNGWVTPFPHNRGLAFLTAIIAPTSPLIGKTTTLKQHSFIPYLCTKPRRGPRRCVRKRCDRQQARPLQARARRKARLPGSQLHTLSKMASFASTSSSRIAQVGPLALNYADIIERVRSDICLCACAQRVGSVSRPVTTAVPRPAAARQQQLAVQLQAAAQVRAPESSGWARRSSSSSTICGHQSCEVQGHTRARPSHRSITAKQPVGGV